MFVSCAKETAV